MAAFGYLAKLKRDLGLAFDAHFLHVFFFKCSLLNSLLMDKVSLSHLISFSRYQTKCVLSSYLDSLGFFLDQFLKHSLTAEKREEDKNTNI